MPSKILIVDDCQTARMVERVILQGLGYQVIPTADRIQALAALKENSFDLIIIDYNMPDISGIDLAQQIMEEKLAPQCPIALFTSWKTPELDQQCKDAGINACLSKNDFRSDHFVGDLQFVIQGGIEWDKKAS